MYGKFPVFVWDAAAAGTAVGVSPLPSPAPPQKNDGEIHIYINRKYPVENFHIVASACVAQGQKRYAKLIKYILCKIPSELLCAIW